MRTAKVQGRIWATESNFPPLPGMTGATAGMFVGTDNSQPLALGVNRKAALWVNQDAQVVVPQDLYVRRLVIQAGTEWRTLQNRAGGDPVGAMATPAPAGFATPSDARLKTAVRPLSGALRSVLGLTGLRYRWDDTGLDHLTRDVADSVSAGPGAGEDDHRRARDAAVARARDALAGDDIGLLAQDVERVVPEVVHDGPDGYKHIRYQQLTALLIEAAKEQQALIEKLSSRIAACEAR